ncbi:rho guanine nucleotide exchange factor 1 isoform B [Alligator mississippiensis]|uniref:Rho guanine nucleotide exchange factor 1 isoform B n=1 Tax=Alligator mississippiensis TaxID=8496 RepID=A0A151P2K9_ALLMI|nr:rho guanine nucleotide exchange factor 1 isoform B [Alligator mississippiensis]
MGSPVEPPFRRGKGGVRAIQVSGPQLVRTDPSGATFPPVSAPPGGVTRVDRMEEEPQGLGPGGCSQAPPAIIGAEDEDFENDLKQTPDDQSSLFGSLELLRTHPAYLMAFLLHAVLQFDPSPVLCFLHAELLRSLGAKEAKKQFVDFYHSFIDKTGLLRVPIPEQVQFELDRTRPELLPDDIQRQFLAEIQSAQEPEITRQLEVFRSNRQMGMTPGAAELGELESYQTRDKSIREAKEKQLAETLLVRLEDMQSTISTDEERSLAIFASIAAYMKHLGVKTRTGDSKKSKGHFFRKKISGNRKLEEPPRRRGFGILDAAAARWARDTPTDKAAVPDRKGLKVVEVGTQRSRGAAVGAPGPDPPSLAVTISTPPAEGPEGDAGSEAPKTTDMLDVSPKRGDTVEPPTSDTQPPEEAVECESLEPGEPPPFLSVQPEEGAEPRPAPGPELPEPEPPGTWRQLVAPDTLLRLQPTEVKRQEVINELFMTEFAHVRMLRVLLEVFYQPLLADSFLAEDELVAMFPGLEDLLEVHGLFLESLRELRDDNNYVVPEIGDVLLARFEGTEGGWFEKISARFCSCQSHTLKQLKAKQRRDPRFAQFIQEAESQARCRRLQLKDIVPIEMQRLTKYPLLLQNIAKYTEAPEERARVEHAAECCRHILHRVNQEVRDMENFMKMKDYQGRLDLSYMKQSSDPLLSDFKVSDITKRHLVHEGLLTWRVSKDKAVEVQALLLDDLLVLLQRQEERLVLRCQSRPVSALDTAKLSLSPIVRLSSAITRQVATDRKAFYVISSCEKAPQIYELVAQTVSEMKSWCSLIDKTAGSIKLPESSSVKHSRPGQNPPSPSYCREPLLSTSENGASLKETDERDKDRALEGAEFEECSPVPHPHNDTPALAALLALARPLGGAEGALAATALQRGK